MYLKLLLSQTKILVPWKCVDDEDSLVFYITFNIV